MSDAELAARRWADALLAIRLSAVCPRAVGGVLVRARMGPALRAWLLRLDAEWGDQPMKRLPAHITEDRLYGGIDLAATLKHARPIASTGLLAEADEGLIVVPMAERLSGAAAAGLAGALDHGEVRLERDGLTGRLDARIGAILIDEGIDDERAPSNLADRLAFHLDLTGLRVADLDAPPMVDLTTAAERWRSVAVDPSVIEALCAAALALGIDSLRAPMLAVSAARLHAALAGRWEVDEDDVAVVARLVLGPRATRLPSEDPDVEPPPPPPPPDDTPPDDASSDDQEEPKGPLEDLIVEAAKAALPAGLLAQLALAARTSRSSTDGSAGALAVSVRRGRPAGVRRGHPRRGGRLDVVATLRAAAPWQALRRSNGDGRIEVRQDDFRITRFKRRTETLTIFAVDASGSAALRRMAEAKGAVEQVLADCYVRRDHVALVAFRGVDADLLLPPTRSLVRAKRCLAAMAGGGTTPLATGIDAARALAEDARRRGQSPLVVVMTDGRANIARDGTPDRKAAAADAIHAAQMVREVEVPVLFVDTAPRPRNDARTVADAMAAHYLHLPYADEGTIAAWVQQAGPGGAA